MANTRQIRNSTLFPTGSSTGYLDILVDRHESHRDRAFLPPPPPRLSREFLTGISVERPARLRTRLYRSFGISGNCFNVARDRWMMEASALVSYLGVFELLETCRVGAYGCWNFRNRVGYDLIKCK